MKTIIIVLILALAVPVCGQDLKVVSGEGFGSTLYSGDIPAGNTSALIDSRADIKKALELALKYLDYSSYCEDSGFSTLYILPNWDERAQIEMRLKELDRIDKCQNKKRDDINFIRQVYESLPYQHKE